jgi:O-antigen/teichoic acid export membrane protein
MNLRKLLGNLASVTVLRLGMAAMGFGLFWVLSHQLPADALGGFSVLFNTFFLLQTLPLLGLSVHLTREVAAHPEQRGALMGQALWFSAPWALLLALGVGLYGTWQAPASLHTSHWLLGLALLPTAFTLVAESTLVGMEQVRPLTLVNLLEAMVRLGGSALTVHLGGGLDGVFAVFLAGRMLSALLYLRLPTLPRLQWPVPAGPAWLALWREAPPYLGLAVVTAATSRIDVLMLSRLQGLEAAGVYAAAARLYEASQMVSTMALVVIFPVLARLFHADPPAFSATLDRCLRWGLLLGVPLVLCVSALVPALVHLLYAPPLWRSAEVLQVLCVGTWLLALDQLMSTTMLAARAQRDDLTAMVIGLALLLALIPTLLPLMGLVGTAWAVVLALALRLGWRIRWAGRALQLPHLSRQSLRTALAAGAALCAQFGLLRAGLPIWQTLPVALLTHVGLSLLLGAFHRGHRNDLLSLHKLREARP